MSLILFFEFRPVINTAASEGCLINDITWHMTIWIRQHEFTCILIQIFVSNQWLMQNFCFCIKITARWHSTSTFRFITIFEIYVHKPHQTLLSKFEICIFSSNLDSVSTPFSTWNTQYESFFEYLESILIF